MRRLAIAIALFAALLGASAARADYGATVRATSGLVSYWPLDEATGPAITDVVAHLTANLAPTALFGRPPGIDAGGTSVSLSGATSAAFGNVDNFTGDFSLEAWVAPSSTAADMDVISKGTGSTGYHLQLLAGGIPAFQVNGTRIAAPALPAGGWHHIVATFSTRTLALYVDGHPAATGTTSRATLASTQAFTIGRSSRSSALYLQGGLDELAVYGRALDAATVGAHFLAGADTTPPHTLLVTTPPAVSDTPDGGFTFAGSKGGLTFSCVLDGAAAVACPGAFSFDLLRTGTHTLAVTATDRWGDVESPATVYTWAVALPAADAAAPLTTIASGPAALSNSAGAQFALTGSKTKLTWSCRLDGGAWAPCGASVSYANLKEGAHLFEARAKDRWGAVEDPVASWAWTIDRTPPETFVLARNATAAGAGVAQLGSEAGARFECRLGDGDWAPCTAAYPLPAVPAAVQLAVRAIDRAGNADASPATMTLSPPDPVAPVLFSGASASFAVAGNRSVSGLQCSLDGAPATSCPWPLDFTGLGYGPHTLTVTDPKLGGVVFPTIAWTSPLPVPLLAASQFPALLSLGSRGAQAHVAKARLPRLLFQSNAAGVARVRLLRGRRLVASWTAPVIQGSNLVTLPRPAYLRLRPGRYGLEVTVANASGVSAALRLRFDAARIGR